MGNAIRILSKPLRDWNIENRAIRAISKDKLVAAPKYKSDEISLANVLRDNPNLVEELSRKDVMLDSRLKDVFVSSTDSLPEKIVQIRPLPLDRDPVGSFDWGYKEPTDIPEGYATLKQSFEFINGYNYEPDKFTTLYIAAKYKLNHDTVCHIIHYYKTFEVFIPDKKNKVKFGRPTSFIQIEAGKDVKMNG